VVEIFQEGWKLGGSFQVGRRQKDSKKSWGRRRDLSGASGRRKDCKVGWGSGGETLGGGGDIPGLESRQGEISQEEEEEGWGERIAGGGAIPEENGRRKIDSRRGWRASEDWREQAGLQMRMEKC
jgi:hypothetical protein